jgi:hypothetical protein
VLTLCVAHARAQASRTIERALAFVGLAAGVGAVVSAGTAFGSGIMPTAYAPLLAALLLICRARPLISAQAALDAAIHSVGEHIARSSLIKTCVDKLGTGGLVVAAWAALQTLAECVGWVAGSSHTTTFIVAATLADITTAMLVIVAACTFTLPAVATDEYVLSLSLHDRVQAGLTDSFPSNQPPSGDGGRAAGGARREDVPAGAHLAAHPGALQRKCVVCVL